MLRNALPPHQHEPGQSSAGRPMEGGLWPPSVVVDPTQSTPPTQPGLTPPTQPVAAIEPQQVPVMSFQDLVTAMTEGIEATYVKMEAEDVRSQAAETKQSKLAPVVSAEGNADEGAQPSSVATNDMLQAARLMEAALYQDWEDWELAAAMEQTPRHGARCRVVGQMFAGDRAMVPRQSMDFQLRPGEELRLTFRMEEPVLRLAQHAAPSKVTSELRSEREAAPPSGVPGVGDQGQGEGRGIRRDQGLQARIGPEKRGGRTISVTEGRLRVQSTSGHFHAFASP